MWNRFFEDRPRIPEGVIHGDCVQVMQQLPAGSVDLVVTDPPYLVNFKPHDGRPYLNDDNDQWLQPAFKEIGRLMKPNSFCVSFYGWWKVANFMRAWETAGLRPIGHIVWVKPYVSSTNVLNRCHEQAYVLAKGDPRSRFFLDDVQEWGESSGNRLHPTEKPASVLEPVIRAFSDKGDFVLDPFAGSGSTLEAAKVNGRRYLGIELVREYALNAADRLDW